MKRVRAAESKRDRHEMNEFSRIAAPFEYCEGISMYKAPRTVLINLNSLPIRVTPSEDLVIKSTACLRSLFYSLSKLLYIS